jgi:LPS-assembly protein
MQRRARLIFLVLFCCCAPFFLEAADVASKWQFSSPNPETTYDVNTGIGVGTNVTVKYGGTTLTADYAQVNQNSGLAVAQGHVLLQREGDIWRGDSLQYNFKTREVLGKNFKSGHLPFFVQGDVFIGDQNAGVYVGREGILTTDDYANPAYRITAKEIIVAPGDFIEAHSATLWLGKVPVFYFPYYRRSLKAHPNNFSFIPGIRTVHGPYLLTSYNWYWNERLDGTLHLDARLKRGLAGGPDFHYHLPLVGEGTFKYYYARDDEPGKDPFAQPISGSRKRIWFSQIAEPATNLTVRGVLRYQSDPYLIRDFFESEYRKNVQPNTFLEVNKLWDNFGIDAEAQPRINRFFETVERMPDVRLSAYRQQIGASPLYYESESSVGYFRHRFANDATNYYAAFRGDTYHQVTVPFTFFDWLNFLPRVGGRYTYYGEAQGPGAMTSEHNRTIFNTGAELTFKASRVWPSISSSFFEMDGLRHIIQPSINYVYVPRPSVAPQQLPQFDTELPTTRLLPIEFPDYNAIDAIDAQNVLRLSLHNKFQTKRKDGVANLVNWALYSDWRITRHHGQATFADLYSDLDLQPFSWLLLNSETRYNLNDRNWTEANHSATFTPNNTWSVTVGHRYLRDNPALGTNYGNNLIFSSIYYRFNENWGARMSHHFEARDGIMEEQYYTLYHDLRSWTAALTFRIRDNRTGPKDYTVAVTMSLKAFPRFGLGDDAAKPELLVGY